MLGRYRGKREAPKPEKRSEGQTDGLDLEEALGQGGAGGAEDRDILPVGKQPRRKLGAKKIALIAAGSVAALALIVAGVWTALVRAPDVSKNTLPAREEDKEQADPVKEAETDQEEEPATPAGRKEDYYTFLLVGEDTSSGSTDTIMLVSYDVANQAVNFLSIPRDTMVNVSWDIKRVNSVYSAKESSGGGIEGLKTQVSYLTGVTPDFYVMVEWEAVGRVVEALGGVWFDVPFTMNYDDPYQDLHIHQEKGYRLLDGEDAMEVVRWRQNSDGTNYGDTTRVEVQQAFLKAVAAQCLKLENWTKVSAFADILFENVETDIPLNNILWFAQQAMGLDVENVQFFTMPGDLNSYAWSRTYHNNQSYAFADPAGMAELINQHFNPYTREITEDDLQIMYRNKNGSLGITNGTLADSRAASAPVRTSSSSSSGSSGSSSGSASSSSSGTEAAPETEPTLPETGSGAGDGGTGGGAADPGTESGSTADPETENGTAPGSDSGSGAATGTESGGTTDPSGDGGGEPELPPEPVLPNEGSGGDTGAAAGDSTTNSGSETGGTADSGAANGGGSASGSGDTEPPGWL